MVVLSEYSAALGEDYLAFSAKKPAMAVIFIGKALIRGEWDWLQKSACCFV